jgi:hypothetical protein
MKKIRGKDLRKLGFKKEVEENSENPFHYYSYDIGNQCLLISCANDERIDGSYYVEIFEFSDLKFRNLNDLKALVNLLKQVSNG